MLEEIKAELLVHIPNDIVTAILGYHGSVKNCLRLQDWEKCLLHGGKFAEEVMKATHFLRTGNIVKHVSVDSEIRELAGLTQLPESVRILIPRAVRVLYDHRSRRGGAHGSFDPNAMDCMVVVSVCDWVLGELVRVYCTQSPELATKFVMAISAKAVPLVERVGEDYIVLEEGASARKEIGLILYSRYPERTTTEQLITWIVGHSTENVRSSLNYMRKKKLLHRDSVGFALTSLGIKTIEKEISKR
ncbi:hypothetical protein ES708_22157 [subsurface metagenome]